VVYQGETEFTGGGAGVLPDDEVLEVNFQKVKELDLGSIDLIFSNPNSKGITLKLRRGEKILPPAENA
jgi:hypothetical protein